MKYILLFVLLLIEWVKSLEIPLIEAVDETGQTYKVLLLIKIIINTVDIIIQ